MNGLHRLRPGGCGRNHGIALEYGDEVVGQIAARCTEVDSGARNVDRIITGTLQPEARRQPAPSFASDISSLSATLPSW